MREKRKDILKFIVRVLLLLTGMGAYLYSPGLLDVTRWPHTPLLWLFLVCFLADFIPRFFPTRERHIGSRKVYARFYKPRREQLDPALLKKEVRRVNRGALRSAAFYLTVMAICYALYFTRLLDRGAMLLLALVCFVADMVCILFFCPFRTILEKNRCCADCRIYNWDMLMTVLPLAVVPCPFTALLFLPSVLYFLMWEISFHRHPERFLTAFNQNLTCAACTSASCPRKRKQKLQSAAAAAQGQLGTAAAAAKVQLNTAATAVKEQSERLTPKASAPDKEVTQHG